MKLVLLDEAQRQFELAAEIEDEHALAHAEFTLATVLLSCFESSEEERFLEEALALLDEAATLYQELERVDFATVLLTLGETFGKMGELDSAAGVLSRALDEISQLAAVAPLVPDTHGDYDAAAGGLAEVIVTAIAPEEKVLEAVKVLRDAIKAYRAAKAGEELVTFGRNANQIAHAFRHIDDLGLPREAVQKAIKEHLPSVVDKIPAGKPLNQVIEVGGSPVFRIPSARRVH